MVAHSPDTLVHRVCAWCQTEFAQETWLGRDKAEITTWGICPGCRDRHKGDRLKQRRQGKRTGAGASGDAPEKC